jgi:predicted amidohydrolase YtcJ
MTARPLIVGILLALLTTGAWPAAVRAEKGKADVVLRNGKIYTADPGPSMRQAIALESCCPPGLIDTHINPILASYNRSKCSLAGVKATIDALKPVVQTCLPRSPVTPTTGSKPCSSTITASRRRRRISTASRRKTDCALGHGGVNNRGLRSGVSAATPDPLGGKIARDASGTPTGSFADSAAIFGKRADLVVLERREIGDEREGRIHEWLKRD